ncbi:DNA-binding response regulator [Pseudoalteromonas lipolytica]|uniref:DNA-binding response regulator n=1 Tax=Pseudoalteromonas lipolytica TaxID=570156 RepID=A0AAD0RVC2_9GAMM|nr:response regulator transcription factor [Pseudoalteromonas donghaensis]AXV63780.1 DNA-binding response regulator [Pseudoalteromonas donghaensis]
MNKILIADDHPLFLAGLKGALLSRLQETLIECADNYLALFSKLQMDDGELDAVIMDLNMPGATNVSGIYFLRQTYPEIPIIILSAHDTQDTRMECLQAGASEFLSKSIDINELVITLHRIFSGEYQFPTIDKLHSLHAAHTTHYGKLASLTPSQFKVLHLMANGDANKTIADALNISEKTVKNHISAIFTKLEVSNRTQASKIFMKRADQS